MIAVLRRQKVVNLFVEYFGEDRVDFQGDSIIVWWPGLEISNELGQSHFIRQLYAKVRVESNGTLAGTFGLNRTQYTQDEWVSYYCHSHVPRFMREAGSLREWRDPCLGTGPIRQTCSNLNMYCDEDLWRLFIYELDQYVRHESIEGVPYVRLETIGIDYRNPTTVVRFSESMFESSLDFVSEEFISIIKDLVKEIINRRMFKFNYINKSYSIAENPIDILIKVTNLFIELYNKRSATERNLIMDELQKSGRFENYRIINGKLNFARDNQERNNRDDLNLDLEGTRILIFKGTPINLSIIKKETESKEEHFLQLLSPSLVFYITTTILRTINYRYNGTDTERASRTSEAVRYI